MHFAIQHQCSNLQRHTLVSHLTTDTKSVPLVSEEAPQNEDYQWLLCDVKQIHMSTGRKVMKKVFIIYTTAIVP